MKTLVYSIAIAVVLSGLAPLADAGGNKAATGDKSMGTRVDDAKITATVKAKLVADRAGNLVSVNVDTDQGVVHLQGTVPSQQAKMDAERLARQTDGVVSVTNDLRIEAQGAGTTRPDAAGSASPGTTSR
jgi:osmotically-inducible protein OsmY